MGAPVRAEGLQQTPDLGWRKKVITGIVGPIAMSIATIGASQAEVDTSASYPCDPDKASLSNAATRSELARRCLHDLSGKIALVGIDITQQRLDDLRVQASALMKRTTGGIFEPDITALSASASVNAKFHDLHLACVDPSDIRGTGPEMADNLMHLSNFDHVITVTNLPACKKPGDDPFMTLEGIAYPNHNWRYAAEFSSASISDTRGPNEDAFVLDHESLHDEGLGHVGTFRSFRYLQGDGPEYGLYRTIKYKPFTTAKNIDFDYLLGDGSFIENGAPYNVMGTEWYDQNDGVTLNSLQRWRLQWPGRVEGNQTDWLKRTKNGTMLLTNPTAVNHDFGVLDLHRNVDFTTDDRKKAGNAPLSCNQLVIDPIYDPKSHAKDIVEVSFAKNVSGNQLEMVSLGYLDFSAPGSLHRVLTIKDQRITINKTPNGYSVTDTTVDKS